MRGLRLVAVLVLDDPPELPLMASRFSKPHLHRCPAHGCSRMIPWRHVCCSDHWALAPRWLQVKVNEQRDYGLAWKCHPTQEFIGLRDQLVALVNRESARKFARPQGTQLPLLT